MDNSFGNRVHELRVEKGMTLESLAAASGYSDWSTIARIEKGQVSPPASKIISIAKALGVSHYYLMDGKEPEELVSEQEKQLLSTFRQLNYQGKQIVLEYVQLMALTHTGERAFFEEKVSNG